MMWFLFIDIVKHQKHCGMKVSKKHVSFVATEGLATSDKKMNV